LKECIPGFRRNIESSGDIICDIILESSMDEPFLAIDRFRTEAAALRNNAFDEHALLSLLRRILKTFGDRLPKARLEHRRNKWICNFGIPDVPLIMIEPVHGSRNAIPMRWRHQMLDTNEEILDRLEVTME
jgi:hypothetical protein